MSFQSHFIKKHAQYHARVMQVDTEHGSFTTPTFMPVGTRAYVNLMTPEQLCNTEAQIILGGNTYHMLCHPGLATIEALGGMHRMMAWHGPMLTDSGGYQIFSLSRNGKLCKINETGASFKHPVSGQTITMTPTSSIQAQKIIGADIIMAFDHCTPDSTDKSLVSEAMHRTHRWLLESIEYHQQHPHSAQGHTQALFGIIQGSCFHDLRIASAEFVLSQPLAGIAIGGETIGYDMLKTQEIIEWLLPLLPTNKIRYTMGVGLHPQDLIDVVKLGIDIFDCVAPTRNARHGALYCGEIVPDNGFIKFINHEDKGRLLIKKSIYATDLRPIMANCHCYTCVNFSRGYLHYLFKSDAPAYATLACIHNIHVMEDVCRAMRECILTNTS